MVAPSTLQPEEFQFGDSGVWLNGSSNVLPFVDITSIQGLDSAPIRNSVTVREGTHGGWVEAQYEDPRTVVLEGQVYANVSELEDYLDSLKANFAPSITPDILYFGTDAGVRCVIGKSLGFRYSKESLRRLGAVEFQIQIQCEDPRIYSHNILTFSPGSVVLGGNRDSVGVVRITGSRTNPTITLADKTIAFPSYTTSGTIDIDLDTHTIIKDGTTSVRHEAVIANGWPVLQPGANSFSVSGSGTGTVQLITRSAWR